MKQSKRSCCHQKDGIKQRLIRIENNLIKTVSSIWKTSTENQLDVFFFHNDLSYIMERTETRRAEGK